jgi:6-pyruvoyltetrahydropterin/6-carboxytetrahydropterin synthase
MTEVWGRMRPRTLVQEDKFFLWVCDEANGAASNLLISRNDTETMILLTRKADFSSAHFYWNPSWSDEENQRVFGKCANRQGHGHNYTLEVTVAGEIDPVSGFVVDLKLLKDILEDEVVSVYDHRHLNHEVPEFAEMIPTTENMAIAIWRRLAGKIPHAKLHRVRVYETPDLFADFFGEGA